MSRHSNGVRIIFRPLTSNYLSLKEEREKEQEQEIQEPVPPARSGAYRRPEDEVQNEKDSKDKKQPKQSAVVLEGGLEVVVERSPYLRVRVSRCCMGPQTVAKVESERIILAALQKAIASAENDCRVLLSGRNGDGNRGKEIQEKLKSDLDGIERL